MNRAGKQSPHSNSVIAMMPSSQPTHGAPMMPSPTHGAPMMPSPTHGASMMPSSQPIHGAPMIAQQATLSTNLFYMNSVHEIVTDKAKDMGGDKEREEDMGGDKEREEDMGGDKEREEDMGGDKEREEDMGGDKEREEDMGGDKEREEDMGGDKEREEDMGGDKEREEDMGGDKEREEDMGGDKEREEDMGGDKEREEDMGGDKEREEDMGGDKEREEDMGGDKEREEDMGGDKEREEDLGGDRGWKGANIKSEASDMKVEKASSGKIMEEAGGNGEVEEYEQGKSGAKMGGIKMEGYKKYGNSEEKGEEEGEKWEAGVDGEGDEGDGGDGEGDEGDGGDGEGDEGDGGDEEGDEGDGGDGEGDEGDGGDGEGDEGDGGDGEGDEGDGGDGEGDEGDGGDGEGDEEEEEGEVQARGNKRQNKSEEIVDLQHEVGKEATKKSQERKILATPSQDLTSFHSIVAQHDSIMFTRSSVNNVGMTVSTSTQPVMIMHSTCSFTAKGQQEAQSNSCEDKTKDIECGGCQQDVAVNRSAVGSALSGGGDYFCPQLMQATHTQTKALPDSQSHSQSQEQVMISPSRTFAPEVTSLGSNDTAPQSYPIFHQSILCEVSNIPSEKILLTNAPGPGTVARGIVDKSYISCDGLGNEPVTTKLLPRVITTCQTVNTCRQQRSSEVAAVLLAQLEKEIVPGPTSPE